MRASFEAQVKDRDRIYDAISFQPMDNQYTGICLSSSSIFFSFFSLDLHAQMCNIEGYRHPYTQLLKKAAVLHAHTSQKWKEK